jgi:hypothetical protein
VLARMTEDVMQQKTGGPMLREFRQGDRCARSGVASSLAKPTTYHRLPPPLLIWRVRCPAGCEPRRVAEKALTAVVISTRWVDDLVRAMGMEGISKS